MTGKTFAGKIRILHCHVHRNRAAMAFAAVAASLVVNIGVAAFAFGNATRGAPVALTAAGAVVHMCGCMAAATVKRILMKVGVAVAVQASCAVGAVVAGQLPFICNPDTGSRGDAFTVGCMTTDALFGGGG